MDFMTFARQQGIVLLEHEPMSRHTAFRIGGPARFFAQAEGWQVQKLYSYALTHSIPFFLMGNGSNLLVHDTGFPGLVAKLAPQDVKLADCTTLDVTGGTLLSTLSTAAQRHGLTGLEFAQGIPGSVGGGVFMNAGAYGGQISDTLAETRYIDLDAPERGEQVLSASSHGFDYRSSLFMQRPRWMMTRAIFRLIPGERGEIADKMARFAASRREKQPLEYPSAGSAYKRPAGHFAGKLIEDAGLKGYRIGGAQISEKHGGFIVNRGGATCNDVLTLMAHVESEVERQFGVCLEREIRLL